MIRGRTAGGLPIRLGGLADEKAPSPTGSLAAFFVGGKK
jgi:hypothetical protein